MRVEEIDDITNDNFLDIVKGTIVCLNAPKDLELGIDNFSFQLTNEEFRGMNQIPFRTPHLIYYNRTNHEKFGAIGQGPRTCFFNIFTEDNPVVILDFDFIEEDFKIITDLTSIDEKYDLIFKQYRNGIFINQIVPYPEDKQKKWKDLVSFIDNDFLTEIEPINKKIQSTLLEEEENKKSNVFYTNIPQKLTKKGLSPQQITKLNFDKSELLKEIITTKKFKYNNDEEKATRYLLAEIQFSFICFLHGQCLHALKQWKKLIHLFSNCEDALLEYTKLFISFIDVINKQFEMFPKDFIEELEEQESAIDENLSKDLKEEVELHKKSNYKKSDHFLQKTLFQLFLTVEEINMEMYDEDNEDWKRLYKCIKQFKHYLETNFEGCKDLFEQDEDDAPVFV
ncbi:hypothetical protein ABK040_009392 [Willaertia magna]